MNTKLSLILAGVGTAVFFALGVACEVEPDPDGLSDDEMRFAELPSLGEESGWELEPIDEDGLEPELDPWGDDDGVLQPGGMQSVYKELLDGGNNPGKAGCLSVHAGDCDDPPYHHVAEFCMNTEFLMESVNAGCHVYTAQGNQKTSCTAYCKGKGHTKGTCVEVPGVCNGKPSAECKCSDKSVGSWQIDPTIDPFGQ